MNRSGKERNKARWGRRRLAVWSGYAICALLVMASAAPLHPRPTPPTDLEVKAAFALNFIRLVRWPAVPGERDASTLAVCGVAESDFLEAVRKATEGKTVGGRVVKFRVLAVSETDQCRVLIFDGANFGAARSTLSGIRGLPILTVGNGPGFLDAGGMFELVVEERKVRFNAGLEAIRRSGLEVNAKVLYLARNLRPGGGLGF